MVLVYVVDGMDVVDNLNVINGFNGHQRIKGYNGQRTLATNWKISIQ